MMTREIQNFFGSSLCLPLSLFLSLSLFLTCSYRSRAKSGCSLMEAAHPLMMLLLARMLAI